MEIKKKVELEHQVLPFVPMAVLALVALDTMVVVEAVVGMVVAVDMEE